MNVQINHRCILTFLTDFNECAKPLVKFKLFSNDLIETKLAVSMSDFSNNYFF